MPSSMLGTLRVLQEAGVPGGSYRTLKRRLPEYAKEEWRQEAAVGPRILVHEAPPNTLVIGDAVPG